MGPLCLIYVLSFSDKDSTKAISEDGVDLYCVRR